MASLALGGALSFIPGVGPFAAALGGLLGAQIDQSLGIFGKPAALKAPDIPVTMASEGTPGTYVYGLNARVPLHFIWHSSFVVTTRTGNNKRALAQPTTVWGNFVCVAGFHYLGPITQLMAEGKRFWVADPDLDVNTTARSSLVSASAGVYARVTRFSLGAAVPIEITIENTRDGSGNPIAGSPDLSTYDVGGFAHITLDGLYYDGSAILSTQARFRIVEAGVTDANGNSRLRAHIVGTYVGVPWPTKLTSMVVNAGVVVVVDGELVATDPRVFPNLNPPVRSIETTKSPLLVSFNGAGDTSRYPKVELIDLEDMSLASFGNRVPQVECIASGYDDSGSGGRDRTLLADTIEDLLVAHAELEADDVSLSGVDPATELGGLVITGPFQPADPIQSLIVANDLVWQEGTSGDFRGFGRVIEGVDRDTVTIDTEALNVAIGDGAWTDDDVESTRVESNERVKRVTVGFSNYENGLQRGEESEQLDSLRHGQEITLDLSSVTMTPTAAKRISRRLLRESAVRIAKAKVVVGWEAYEVQPDDVLALTDSAGEDWTLLVDRVAMTADYLHEIEGYVVADVPEATPAGSGAPESGSREGDSGDDPKARGATPLVFVAAEARPLADDHASRVGFYVGAAPAGNGVAYEGSTVWIRRDGDAWLEVGQLPRAATIGHVADATASGTTTGYDAVTEIDVEVRHGTPEGTTEALCDLGRNLAIVGSEVIGYTNVTAVDDENYTLDNLSRGRCDTAAAVGTHAAGESFMLLNEAVAFVPLAIEDIGTDVEVAVTAPGDTVDDVVAQTLTIAGLTATPLELDSVTLTNPGGSLVTTWVYRSLRSARFRVPTTEPVEPGETVLLQFWNTTVAGITGTAVHEVEIHAAPGSYRIESPGDFGIVGSDVAVRAKVRSSLVGLVSTPAADDLAAVYPLPLDPSDLDFDEGDASTTY